MSKFTLSILVAILLVPSVVFAAAITESGGARLTISDSTDQSAAGMNVPVTFYAQFVNVTNGQSVNGTCIIAADFISPSYQPMTYNGLGDGRYNFSVPSLQPGEQRFIVTCSAWGLGPVNTADMATCRYTANISLRAPTDADALGLVGFNVSYYNSSNGMNISSANCYIRFQPESGSPTDIGMDFNSSTNRYEARRSFPTGGSFWYNVSCKRSDFDAGNVSGIINIRMYLPNASKFNDSLTTNFSSYSSLDSVQLILSNQYGRIKWGRYVNATMRNFDAAVRLGDNFVWVNTSALGAEYNTSVEVVLNNAYGNMVVVSPPWNYDNAANFRSNGIPCSQFTNPSCEDSRLTGNLFYFRASYPVAFTIGADSNISAWSDGPIAQRSIVTIFVNYTNASNGAPIPPSEPYGGMCSVSFGTSAAEPSSSMMYYENSLYRFSRQVNISGAHSYNVTCDAATYTFRQADGGFVAVSITAPDQSSVQVVNTTVAPSTVQPAASTPASSLGPVDPNEPVTAYKEDSPSKILIATSGGVATSIISGEMIDVNINGVIIRAGVEGIEDGVVAAKLGSQIGSISQGQELLMDVDRDGEKDISMKVLGVSRDSVKMIFTKLRDGSDGSSEDSSDIITGDAIDDGKSGSSKKRPIAIEEPFDDEGDGNISWWWFILMAAGILLVGDWYYRYNQRMRGRFL